MRPTSEAGLPRNLAKSRVTQLADSGPKCAELRRISAEHAHMWPNSGNSWPELGHDRQKLIDSGTHSAEVGRVSAQIAQTSGRNWRNSDRTLSNKGHAWPKSGHTWPNQPKFEASSPQRQPTDLDSPQNGAARLGFGRISSLPRWRDEPGLVCFSWASSTLRFRGVHLRM